MKTFNKTTTTLVAIAFFSVIGTPNKSIAQTCPGLGSLTLNIVPPPAPTLNAPSQLCVGANGTISVNQVFSTYSWNTGGSDQSIVVNAAGSYTVTVTNAPGCSGTASVTITEAPTPTPQISQNPYNCAGVVSLNAGAGFSNYAWSNGGGNSQVANYTTSGIYTVTVTNAQGCTGTDDFNVTIPSPPIVTISGDLSFCTGLNTTLTATAGFSSYAWNNGGTGSSISAGAGGVYTVTVTDNFGCTDTESATVVSLQSPAPTVANAQICPDQTTTISVSNGPFQNYSWSNGSNSSSTVVGIGNYAVTVTASNGCTGTAAASVTALPTPNPNITQGNYTCNGVLTLSAGAGFTSYNWSNSNASPSITVNTSGVYTVTVTNAQGCTGTDSYLADIPPPPVVDITGDGTFCSGLAANLSATAGLTTYAWSSGQNGANISVNTAGTYTVTATDAFGCTTTDNFSVSALTSPQPVIAGTSTICDGTSTTFNTTVGFVAYSWSNGQTSPDITVDVAGTYTVTVTAANGCTGTDTQTLGVIPSPNPNINASPYACNDQLTLNAGGVFTTYAWSNSGNGSSTVVTASGNYDLTVTDAQGCTGVDSYFADIPAPPQVDISGNNTLCSGSSSNLTASDGLESYVWSNGQIGQEIIIINAGLYSVTATDAFGCTVANSITIAPLTSPQPIIQGPNSICEGLFASFSTSINYTAYIWSNGAATPTIDVAAPGTYTVTVTASNGCTGVDNQVLNTIPAPDPNITQGTYACDGQLSIAAAAGFSSYLWNTSNNTPSIVVNSSGDYSVTVTNTQGCTGTETYLAVIPDAPIVDISGNNTFCTGGSSALNATPGFNAYLWSSGEITPGILVSAAGNYSVTATDPFGCTATNVIGVGLLPQPLPTISGPSQICPTGSATYSVPGSFLTFNWSTGTSDPSITVNTAGIYTVTVSDVNGCTGTDSQILTIGNNLQPQITTLPYACNNQLALDAGAGFATYSWSGGQNTQGITVLSDGTYTVTVTDGSGCNGTATISASLPAPPIVGITGVPAICAGTTTGLTASTGFSSYAWNTGQVGDSIVVGLAGTYSVTASDALGCTASADFQLSNSPAPQPDITGPAFFCTNTSVLLATNSSFSQYNWSTGATGASISVNTPNTYTVTVTDALGCTGTDSQLITEVTGLNPTVTLQPYNCSGLQTLDAGAGFTAYTWSGGQTTSSISVGVAGTYAVTVTDGTGCTGVGNLLIDIPAPPAVGISGQNVFCQNGNTTLTASPGFSSYTWNSGQSSSTITVTQSGTYSVTITDGLGCTDAESIQISTLPAPQPLITGPSAICAGNTTTLTLSQVFSSYSWSDGTSGNSLATNLAGTYTVTVTDANGCSGTDAATLIVSQNPVPTITAAPYACNGQIDLSAASGFTNYAWSGPGGFSNNTPSASVTVGGTYTVTVTDANGCTGTAEQATTVPALNLVAISGPAQFCPGGSAGLSASGGFNAYTWSNGGNQALTTVALSGTYTVTATDALGCTSTSALTVIQSPAPVPVVLGPAAACPGSSVTLGVGNGFSNILWSNGASGANTTVFAPFSGSVTVTDGNGCQGIANAAVTLFSPLTVNISALPYACNGQITLDAGVGGINYTWSGPGGFNSNGQQAVVTESGNYSVVVLDNNGCSATASIPVTVPAAQPVAISGLTQICTGQSTQLTATGGFVSYNWSTGASANTITVALPGVYGVTASDAQGCTHTAAVTVSPLPGLTVNIASQPYLCNGQLTLLADAGFAGYSWNTTGTTQSITVSQSGTYTVTVTNAQGCSGAATIQAVLPAAPQTTIAGSLIFCPGGNTTLLANAGFTAYNWNTGNTTAAIQVNTSGAYTVTVSDANGCTATATAQVQTYAAPVVQIAGGDPICPGETVSLQATSNNSTFVWSDGSNSPVLSVNQAGSYTVTVTDANGCTASSSKNVLLLPGAATTISNTSCRIQEVGTETLLLSTVNGCDSIVTIITSYAPDKPGLALDLAPVIEASLGEIVTLDVAGNFPIDSVAFQSPFTLSCTNCLAPMLTAVASGFVQVTAFDPDGCRTQGAIQILVNKSVNIYVPNVFQPGSPSNGFFSVFSGPEITAVRNFHVFDRWGDLMFSRDDMPTNVPEAGWDGTFRNQPMQPGVYVYYFEVQLADGSTELFRGDVTILQ